MDATGEGAPHQIEKMNIPPLCPECHGDGYPGGTECEACRGSGRQLEKRDEKKAAIMAALEADPERNRQAAMLAVLTLDDAVEEVHHEGRVLHAFPSGFLPMTNLCLYCSLRGEQNGCWNLPISCDPESREDGLSVVFAEQKPTP